MFSKFLNPKNEQEILIYDEAEKNAKDYIATMDQKYREGFEKGERKKQLEIAKAMLLQGVNAEIIAKTTGIVPEEIESGSLQTTSSEILWM